MNATYPSSVRGRWIAAGLFLIGLTSCGKPPQPAASVLPTPVQFNEMGEPATGPAEPLVIPAPRPPRPLVRPSQA